MKTLEGTSSEKSASLAFLLLICCVDVLSSLQSAVLPSGETAKGFSPSSYQRDRGLTLADSFKLERSPFTFTSTSEVAAAAPNPKSSSKSSSASSGMDSRTEQRLRDRWNAFMSERTKPVEFVMEHSSPRTVHAVEGKPLFLSCAFNRELTGKLRVSFMRIRDIALLSVGRKLHLPDPRIEVINKPEAPRVWTLKLNEVRNTDAGLYECQLNTNPETKRVIFNVSVVATGIAISPPDPVTYLNVGSRLRLTCTVRSGPLRPQFIMWYRDNKILEYAEDSQAVITTNYGTEDSGHESVMEIGAVRASDSGEYRCNSDLTDAEAAVTVFVVREDTKSLHAVNGDGSGGVIETSKSQRDGGRYAVSSSSGSIKCGWLCSSSLLLMGCLSQLLSSRLMVSFSLQPA